MAITITRDLNVVSVGVPPVIHLSQYDSDFTLVFNLCASTGAFTMPTGTTAEIRGTKRDGNGYDAAASVSGSTVTVTGDEQMTAIAGQNMFEIATYYNNKRLNTINFILDVERAALDADTITSESVLRELDAIIQGAATATQAAEDAEDAADRAEEAADDLSGTVQQVATNTQDIAGLKDDLSNIEGISDDVKVALLDVVSHIALWTDGDGQQYYNALYDALYAGVEWPDLTIGTITKGYYYDASGNTVSGDVNSDFINEKYFEIDPEQTYIWVRGFDGGVVENEPTLGATFGYRICYYDENKDFISRQVSASYNTFGEVEPRYYTLNVPSNAKYFRVSWNRFPIGNIYKHLNDFYAVTLVLANLDDSNISSPSQLMEKFSVTRDGTDITAIAEFTKPDLKPSDWNNISSARNTIYWRYNVFNANQGGSPEYGNQNPSTRTRITNRYSLLCKKGDIIHFDGVKAGVRAERISDGDVQYTTAWITDDSDFVIGGE